MRGFPRGGTGHRPVAKGLPAILALLTTTGWAANHFAALLPVLRHTQHLSASLVAGLYALYAVGLLPGLLAGGSASDRWGRRTVALPGAAVAVVGTLLLLFRHDATGLVAGRLVVGLGAGAAFSAGTAWAGDLAGSAGVARAGVFLTGGFALGPVVSGGLAQFGPAPLILPFALSATLSAVALLAAAQVKNQAEHRHSSVGVVVHHVTRQSARTALSWALPVAPWVFAGATVGVVTLPSRLPASDGGPLLAGIASGVVLGTGVLVQTLARRTGAGPAAGALGALAAAAGFLVSAAGGAQPGLALVAVAFLLLGVGYGLCLRAGLLDLGRWAPPHRRGGLTGAFYVATYSGFAVPVLLQALEPVAGSRWPLVVLAVLAAGVAGLRWFRVRRLRTSS